MKVQITPQKNLKLQQSNKNQNSTNENCSKMAFGGGEAVTQFLTFLQTNQAIGATVVDAGCMGIPRSAVDFTRGPEAGVETMRREFSSTINDVALGAYGMGAAWLLSQGLNKEYGIKANKMFVDNDTLDILTYIRNASEDIKESKNLENYLSEIFENAKGFNPNIEGSEKTNGWVEIKGDKTQIIEKLSKEIKNGTEEMSKDAKAYLKALLVHATGVESEFKLEKNINGKTIKSVNSVDDFIDNVYKVSKAFMSEKVIDVSNGKISGNFIDNLKKLNKRTAILGVATCSIIGACVQPLNMYLTKRKTGKAGFVGGGEEDKSAKFKMLKTGVAALAAFAAFRSVGKFGDIFKNIQFKGLVPTISQFKVAYGITIVSRLLAARNKNELRESSIKDSLGFANWLILGGFVSKLTAMGVEKLPVFKAAGEKFTKYNAKENGEGLFNLLTKSSVLTREEVLHEAFEKAGIPVIKKGKGLDLKAMLKEIPKMADGAAKTALKTKLRYLNLIQLAGYLYSGLVLGIGIPKLNIAITNAVEKKKKLHKNM